MNRGHTFQTLGTSALIALVGLGLLFTASGANAAGCATIPYKVEAAPSDAFLMSSQHGEESKESANIVGLWHVVYTATSAPNPPFPTPPFQFLESYKTWHADGTEFENAFLPPAGGNICFGVWKKSKDGSVKLHHIGLMFDAAGKVSNIFTVDEIDTVADDGKTYTGSFDFKLFDPTDVYGAGTPLAEVKGTMGATRISVPKNDD
jgi:hypothetical protein